MTKAPCMWAKLALLALLVVGLVGANAASAHHHDEASPAGESCEMCVHAASAAVPIESAASFCRPSAGSPLERPADVAPDEGSGAAPRGRGPPSALRVF